MYLLVTGSDYIWPPQTDVVQYLSRLAIADALGCKICVMRDKKNVLDCLEDIGLRERISLNFNDSCLHVLPMNKLNPKVCILNSCPILYYLQVLCQEFNKCMKIGSSTVTQVWIDYIYPVTNFLVMIDLFYT